LQRETGGAPSGAAGDIQGSKSELRTPIFAGAGPQSHKDERTGGCVSGFEVQIGDQEADLLDELCWTSGCCVYRSMTVK